MKQVIEGKIQEFRDQEEVESAIQRECKGRFTLAHSTPIMRTLLGEKLRYLSDNKTARQIITDTYDITRGNGNSNHVYTKGDRPHGSKDSKQGRKQNINNTRRFPKFLEKSERIHLLISIGNSLQALQSCCAR